jgi:zinc transport system permease protein
MFELLSYTFVQHAFIGGVAMAVLAGLLGPLVVQSRQSIASDMFAHVALAGIGAALIVGVAPWWGALPMLLVMSTALWWLTERRLYSPDALAMLFLSGGLALALALVHIARDRVFAFENYLFGSILTLTEVEVWTILGAAVVVGIIVYWLWYPLIGATQSPRYYIPYSARPQLMQLLYFWLLALVVWIGIKTIGGLLIGALLVIPVLIARPWARSFAMLTRSTTAIAVAAVTVGLLTSLLIDVPPSSLIIGVLIAAFLLQLIVRTSWRPH